MILVDNEIENKSELIQSPKSDLKKQQNEIDFNEGVKES